VLFNADYSVYKAILIPHEVVLKLVKPDEYVSGHRLLLRNDVWDAVGVKDVTGKLKAVWH